MYILCFWCEQKAFITYICYLTLNILLYNSCFVELLAQHKTTLPKSFIWGWLEYSKLLHDRNDNTKDKVCQTSRLSPTHAYLYLNATLSWSLVCVVFVLFVTLLAFSCLIYSHFFLYFGDCFSWCIFCLLMSSVFFLLCFCFLVKLNSCTFPYTLKS